jgi:hypothetical protein
MNVSDAIKNIREITEKALEYLLMPIVNIRIA